MNNWREFHKPLFESSNPIVSGERAKRDIERVCGWVFCWDLYGANLTELSPSTVTMRGEETDDDLDLKLCVKSKLCVMCKVIVVASEYAVAVDAY